MGSCMYSTESHIPLCCGLLIKEEAVVSTRAHALPVSQRIQFPPPPVPLQTIFASNFNSPFKRNHSDYQDDRICCYTQICGSIMLKGRFMRGLYITTEPSGW